MTERDAFLRLIRQSQRGRLKVYLGYAAGVGKTYQMLQEAHRLKQEWYRCGRGTGGNARSHGDSETHRGPGGHPQISSAT